MLSAPVSRVNFENTPHSRGLSAFAEKRRRGCAKKKRCFGLRRAVLLNAAFFAFIALSCGYRAQPRIDPGADFFRYGEEWAVVVEPYVVFKAEPGHESAPLAYGRKGDVEKITGRAHKRTAAQSTLWLHFEKGWLAQSSVRIEQTKLKALSAARADRLLP